jgi:DnaJ-domain-containing protein 1
MTDYFVLLDQPRQPWLEADILKAVFLARSTELHPDRVHESSKHEKELAQARFTELNTAYTCLREPRNRLAHLLELESGVQPKAIDQAPEAAMDFFVQIGQACRAADSFAAEQARLTSPILKASSIQRGLGLTEQLQAFQARLQAEAAQRDAELKELNQLWISAPPVGSTSRSNALAEPLARLQSLYRDVSYLTRWKAQIQERLVQLAS